MSVFTAFSNNKELASWPISKLKLLHSKHQSASVRLSKKKRAFWAPSATQLYHLISSKFTLSNLNSSSNSRPSPKNKSRSSGKLQVPSDRPLVAWLRSGPRTSSQDQSWLGLSQRRHCPPCPKIQPQNHKKRSLKSTHWTRPWSQPSDSATVALDQSRTSHIANSAIVNSIDCMLDDTTATTAQGVVVAIAARRT